MSSSVAPTSASSSTPPSSEASTGGPSPRAPSPQASSSQAPAPRFSVYLELVAFSHTIFALPFALAAMVLAADGMPALGTFGLILVAMVSARTGAMAVNRVADATIDAGNPRTAGRPIPRGAVSRGRAVMLALVSFAVLGVAAWGLNPLCFKLFPLALLVLVGYSYTKRFTPYTHIVLGLALGAAPVGAWLAVRGTLDPEVFLLGAAVLLWVGGFDILYALQDKDIDEREGLHSLPVRFGVRRSLAIARYAHAGTVILLILFGAALGRGMYYFIGAAGVAALLVYEHMLVRGGRLDRITKAFFDLNGYIGILFFMCVMLDVFLS